MSKASKMFEDFNGYEVQGKTEIPFNNPKRLVLLGRAVLVVYESNKFNGGGDGTMAFYEHEFDKHTLLTTDETGKQLYIVGPKLRVDASGIIN